MGIYGHEIRFRTNKIRFRTNTSYIICGTEWKVKCKFPCSQIKNFNMAAAEHEIKHGGPSKYRSHSQNWPSSWLTFVQHCLVYQCYVMPLLIATTMWNIIIPMRKREIKRYYRSISCLMFRLDLNSSQNFSWCQLKNSQDSQASGFPQALLPLRKEKVRVCSQAIRESTMGSLA